MTWLYPCLSLHLKISFSGFRGALCLLIASHWQAKSFCSLHWYFLPMGNGTHVPKFNQISLLAVCKGWLAKKKNCLVLAKGKSQPPLSLFLGEQGWPHSAELIPAWWCGRESQTKWHMSGAQTASTQPVLSDGRSQKMSHPEGVWGHKVWRQRRSDRHTEAPLAIWALLTLLTYRML